MHLGRQNSWNSSVGESHRSGKSYNNKLQQIGTGPTDRFCFKLNEILVICRYPCSFIKSFFSFDALFFTVMRICGEIYNCDICPWESFLLALFMLWTIKLKFLTEFLTKFVVLCNFIKKITQIKFHAVCLAKLLFFSSSEYKNATIN